MTELIYSIKTTPAFRAMSNLNKYLVEESGLDPKLRMLINLRVSQINRCSTSVAFYSRELCALGETRPRLNMLNAWREAPFYSARERAALEWAEAITVLSSRQGSDKIYRAARAQFTDGELANLTLAVAAINSWNRLSIAVEEDRTASQPPRFSTSR